MKRFESKSYERINMKAQIGSSKNNIMTPKAVNKKKESGKIIKSSVCGGCSRRKA